MVMALGIVIVGLVLCGVAMALTAVGVNLGPVAMSPVPLADVLEQGAWFLWSFLLPYRWGACRALLFQ